MADLLVDTDIFVDHLRGAHELRAKGHRLHYSVVTRAELCAGSTATDLSTHLLAPFASSTSLGPSPNGPAGSSASSAPDSPMH